MMFKPLPRVTLAGVYSKKTPQRRKNPRCRIYSSLFVYYLFIFALLEFELRALCLLGRHCNT
jgi:hypothetical protein